VEGQQNGRNDALRDEILEPRHGRDPPNCRSLWLSGAVPWAGPLGQSRDYWPSHRA
jgi:hypothetical protein